MALSELKQLGIDPRAQTLRFSRLSLQERQFEFQRHLESYVNEVIRDEPVSNIFNYWLGQDSRLYLQPNPDKKHLASAMFNPQERDGVYIEGFKNLEKLLVENPGKTILWYSPIGKAEFNNNEENPFSQISYDYGQLYLYYRKGNKVDGLALKTSKDAEDFLYGDLSSEEKIKQTILSSMISDFNLKSFPENLPFYTDHKGKEYFIKEIIAEIQERISGKKKQYVEVYDKTIEEMMRRETTEEVVRMTFQKAIFNHMIGNNLTKKLLAGSCGGSIMELDDLPFAPENFLFQRFNPASTVFRITTQGLKELMKQEHRHKNYNCPSCGSLRQGEIIGSERSNWTPCQNCGHLYVC